MSPSEHSSGSPRPAHELETISTTVVYSNRWMTVREDKTLRRDGVEGTFGVVEKPDFALVIPYFAGGFHLVEQYRYPVRGRYWEFPAGAWEDNPNADPLSLAHGELSEETGLRAATMIPLGHLFEAYGYSSQGFHVFLATDLTIGNPDLEVEEEGLISKWFSEAEVWQLVASGRFKDAASVAALALFARYREEHLELTSES
jgi:8-oxo-dGTP pyrophosphatase MutT (NUDIX family)